MPFKFDAIYAFLTYPQTSADHGELHEFLNTICATEWCRICTEQHEDGQPHIHLVCKFTRRFQSRNERIFDWRERHPNIQSVRSVHKSLEYISKDGQFTDFGTVPVAPTKRTARELYTAAATETEHDYWVSACESGINFMYAKKFRELAWKPTGGETITDEYVANPQWESDAVKELPLLEGMSTVIIGTSGMGKTAWAKRVSPKPALWVCHIDVLRMFRPDYHKSIIFDDMSFSKWPETSQIHLVDVQQERQLHCRYACATIPAGTVKIFTCNKYPFYENEITGERLTAIERRIQLYVV